MVVEPRLPVARFRRLAATDAAMAALDTWWDIAPTAERPRIVAMLAERTDAEVVELLACANVPTGTADVIVGWALSTSQPVFAARLAVLVEQTAEKPRATLIGRLQRIS